MRTFGRMRRRIVGGVSTAAALVAVGVLAPAAGAQVALTPCPAPVVAIGVSTVTCAYTGTAQTWTVPTGVTSATFDLFGASGGNGHAPGAGGETTATIPVVAGTTYQVMVGGRGGDEDPGESLVAPLTPFSTGGFNGGGNGGMGGNVNGAGGGGASDIRLNGDCAAAGACALTDRIAVAAGGGGGGTSVYGIGGGGGAGGGASGSNGDNAPDGGFGGYAGRQVAGGHHGGAPPGGGQEAPEAEDGSLGQGGHGSNFSYGGGPGGGGGRWGGGGGGGAVVGSGGSGGGGGGSALVPSGGTTTPGVRANDDGLVTITYTAPASYPSLVLAQNPGAYWRFDEASGTTAFDQSPNHNDGTYLNGVTLGAAGAISADTAASFDGVNDSVRVPDSNSLDVGDSFTLEGWIKRSSATKAQELFNKGSGGLQLTVMSAANGNQVWLRKANVTTIAQSTAGVPADGRFHHIVVTKNGTGPNSTVIYIDGVAGTVLVSPVQVIANTAFPLTFSGAGTTQHVLDEFAIYDGVLSAADVVAHYTAGAGI